VSDFGGTPNGVRQGLMQGQRSPFVFAPGMHRFEYPRSGGFA
jgi:hypothetical protein